MGILIRPSIFSVSDPMHHEVHLPAYLGKELQVQWQVLETVPYENNLSARFCCGKRSAPFRRRRLNTKSDIA